jgi:hypothetical protein
MGPKKSNKVDDSGDRVELLNNKLQALQKQLVQEQELSDASKAAENEVKERVMYLEKDLKGEKVRMRVIVTAMTQQYKQMQEEKSEEIATLKENILKQDAEIKHNEEAIVQLKKDLDEKVRVKDQEISDLKKKMDEMHAQFSEMLSETLHKMQERISKAQWNHDEDQMMKKINKVQWSVEDDKKK